MSLIRNTIFLGIQNSFRKIISNGVKKSIILLILLLFSFEAYPFWIWSPKTQKWKNPKYAALATPYLQYKQAVKYFDEDEYKEAYEEFKKLLVNYPDAKEAAEAQYYLARCLEKFDKSYEAFIEYQKLIDSYPNSQRINEVVEREYNIGEYFLNRESKEWLGLSVYDFVEHPSIQIFRGIVDKVPYSEYAPRAQYKLGMIFFQLGRYEESRIAFQKVIDDYPDSEWAAPGKYQLALATSRAFSGADYDSSYLQEATSRLDEFIREHPEEKISGEAEDQLKVLRNKEARKLFDTGKFYENQGQYKSSIIYYKKVVKNYPNSDYYTFAVESIEELELLIRRNLTKSELKKQEREIESKAVREEKANEKQIYQENKIQREQERIADKKELKKSKLEVKRGKRQEKIDKKREVKEAKLAKKQVLREDKVQNQQERIRAKKVKKQAKIDKKKEAKLAKKQLRIDNKNKTKQERIADKKELKESKLEAKRDKRQEKIDKKREAKETKRAKRQEKIDEKKKAKARKKALKEEALKKKQQEENENKKKFWFW